VALVTLPDSHDWTPGSVIVANSRSLINFANPVYLPVTSAAIDTTAFNSVTVSMSPQGNASVNAVELSLIWTVAGAVSAVDYYSVFNGGPIASAQGSAVISTPCKGDSLTLNFKGNSVTPQIVYGLVGSSRTLAAPTIWTTNTQDDQMGAWGNSQSIPAGLTATSYVGPFARGARLTLACNTAGIVAQLNAYILESSTWVQPIVASLASATAPRQTVEVDIPGRALVLNVSNTTGAAVFATYSISEMAP
jgi:hypothetical protein